MLPANATRSCVIAICQGKSTQWRKVTENVFSRGQANNALPSYVKIDDVICMNCYNGIMTNSSVEFQQHAQASIRQHRFEETRETNEAENTNDFFSFSKAIEVITKILYDHEKEKKPTIYSFDEFRTIVVSYIFHLTPLQK
jgi:hypothetical protein